MLSIVSRTTCALQLVICLFFKLQLIYRNRLNENGTILKRQILVDVVLSGIYLRAYMQLWMCQDTLNSNVSFVMIIFLNSNDTVDEKLENEINLLKNDENFVSKVDEKLDAKSENLRENWANMFWIWMKNDFKAFGKIFNIEIKLVFSTSKISSIDTKLKEKINPSSAY